MFSDNGLSRFSPILKCCAGALLVVGFCWHAQAQMQSTTSRSTLPKYDVKTEKKLKGIVQEIKRAGEGRHR